MANDPTFSVIVIDYDRSVTRDEFRRKIQCLADQTCQDFEVLVYHDGPKITSYQEDIAGLDLPNDVRFFVTEDRANDWGHSNRDRGIREAKGEWIIHTNADNVFYPNLIEKLRESVAMEIIPIKKVVKRRYPIIVKSIARRIDKYCGTNIEQRREVYISDVGAVVYAIRMQGLIPNGKNYQRHPTLASTHSIIFGGVPIKRGQIDAMQFVMRRDLWMREGGWHDKSEESDGVMYPKFAEKYVVLAIPEVLGEHW